MSGLIELFFQMHSRYRRDDDRGKRCRSMSQKPASHSTAKTSPCPLALWRVGYPIWKRQANTPGLSSDVSILAVELIEETGSNNRQSIVDYYPIDALLVLVTTRRDRQGDPLELTGEVSREARGPWLMPAPRDSRARATSLIDSTSRCRASRRA